MLSIKILEKKSIALLLLHHHAARDEQLDADLPKHFSFVIISSRINECKRVFVKLMIE